MTYNFISLCMLYWLPLLAIITCYTVVYVRSIYQQKKSAAIKNQQQIRLRSTASNSGESLVLIAFSFSLFLYFLLVVVATSVVVDVDVDVAAFTVVLFAPTAFAFSTLHPLAILSTCSPLSPVTLLSSTSPFSKSQRKDHERRTECTPHIYNTRQHKTHYNTINVHLFYSFTLSLLSCFSVFQYTWYSLSLSLLATQ